MESHPDNWRKRIAYANYPGWRLDLSSLRSLYPFINKIAGTTLKRRLFKAGTFIILYSLCSAFLIPLLARQTGRVPLPVLSNGSVKPLNMIYPLLNRHYVRPALRNTVNNVAHQIQKRNPGTEVRYLDGGFPFINGFPLLPHLSHNDGKKLDLAFYYKDHNGTPTNKSPSAIGYGACGEPHDNEPDTPLRCSQRGYWQYNILKILVGWSTSKSLTFDEARTRQLIIQLTKSPTVGKIFIEPHLVQRLKLTNNKIRFHGCQAVRHDDHIHIQLQN